jgi:hypothetical protein
MQILICNIDNTKPLIYTLRFRLSHTSSMHRSVHLLDNEVIVVVPVHVHVCARALVVRHDHEAIARAVERDPDVLPVADLVAQLQGKSPSAPRSHGHGRGSLTIMTESGWSSSCWMTRLSGRAPYVGE